MAGIDLPRVFNSLTNRFKTRPGDPVEPTLAQMVMPVTLIDPLMRTPVVNRVTKNLTAAAGTYTVYRTVAAGKRETIRRLFRDSTAANSYVMVSIGGTNVKIAVAGTAEAVVPLPVDILLVEGDSFGMTTTGNAGDTAIGLEFIVDQEDAF